ncbi:MAG: hypothetical protein PHG67_06150 [Bacteroidales bacterium]|jgi:hypothetical protein|nr:hypothetical protein [Bacteroidales bacterium]HOI32972.1 hypothetical protein [Bacteroidales bacterium]
MKKFLILFMALMSNMLIGATVAGAVGLNPLLGSAVLTSGAVAIGQLDLAGSLRAGIYTEVWTGEMIKAFRNSVESIGWLARIRDYSQYAENDLIHFVDIGGDPDVLVNNTTYPIDVQDLTDADKAIALDKYQTKATRITDDELYAISYDKMGSVIERHRESIDSTKYSRAIHALAPAGHTSATPVLLTTGSASPDGGRKMLTRADIINLKKAYDKLKVPSAGRILVLNPDHVADLLLVDQKFADQYYNYTSGKIANMYGFEVYEFVDNPYFKQNKTKVAYGAVPGVGEYMASVSFFAPRMMKVTGSTKSYLSAAKDNPTTQENLANFRHYFIALPLKNEAIGALVSATA